MFTNQKYYKYNGIYVVGDVGGAIKNNKIDFFLGDFNSNEAAQAVWDFGVTRANIYVIEKPK